MQAETASLASTTTEERHSAQHSHSLLMSAGTVTLSPFASLEAMLPSALVVGSTGAVGRQLLRALLQQSHFAKTYELGRRKTQYPVKGVQTPSEAALNKLTSVVVPDEAFEDVASLKAALPESKDWSSVYITLGTTRADAGSAEAFEKIDREYVINAAKAAKLDVEQRLVYCSSMGADSKSFFPYPRSKGLTEAELTSLGYKETIIFRPGMLRPVGGRDHPRMVEAIAGFFTKNILSHLSDNAEIQTDLLGKAMMLAGEMGIDVCLKNGFGKMTKLGKDGQEALIISNAEAAKLAKIDL